MLKKLFFATALTALLLSASLVSAELVYAEQLPPGILIAGQSFSGQNKVALRASLESLFNTVNDRGVTLVMGDKQLHVSFLDTGITPDYDGMIAKAFTKSHSTIPGQGTLRTITAYLTRSNNVPLAVTINEDVRRQFLDSTLHPTLGERAVDAGLMIKDSVVSITEAANGLSIEDVELMNRITLAIQTGAEIVTVPNTVQKPDVLIEDLAIAKTEAEDLIGRVVTLDANGAKLAVARHDLANWIFVQAVEGIYHAKLDPEKIKTYLNEKIVPKVNKKTIAAVKEANGEVTKDGQDGATLQIDDSIGAITKVLAETNAKPIIKLAVVTKNKSTITVNPQEGCDANKAPGKYIELNLTGQRMCLYEGATFVNSFRVSTGKWSTPTPVGTFAIQNKIRVAYSAKYGLYMPYWMAIVANGEYGIHGLPYRGNWIEGESHIGTPVSHGCIRLGPGNDVFVNNWTDIGIPVFIHK